MEYKGWKIEKETDPWALKFGMLYRFFKDEKIYSAISEKAAQLEIDAIENGKD